MEMNAVPAGMNPFSQMLVALPPQRFAGRGEQVRLFLQGVSAEQPVSFSLSGPRTIGKTSLLKFLADPAGAAPRFRQDYLAYGPPCENRLEWVYVDFYKIEGGQMFAHLWQRLRSEARLAGLARGILDEATGGAEISQQKAALRELCARATQKQVRLVFCLDHFDETFRTSQFEDHQFLRGLTAEHAWIIVTEKKLTELRQDSDDDRYWTSPLGPVLKAERLKLLEANEVRQLVSGAAPGLPAELLDWMLALAGAHPYLVTLVGEGVYNLLASGGAELRLEGASLQQIQHQILAAQPVTELLRMFWRQLDDRKRSLLLGFAGEWPGRPVPPIPEADLPALTALLEDCLVERQPPPQNYRIFCQLFRLFILQQHSGVQEDLERLMEGLTPVDQKLLRYLMAHPNQVCGFAELYAAIWNKAEEKRGLEAAIHRLRLALQRNDPSGWNYIRNQRGQGYLFSPRPA